MIYFKPFRGCFYSMVSYRARDQMSRKITMDEFRFMQRLEIIPAVAVKFEENELLKLNDNMRH